MAELTIKKTIRSPIDETWKRVYDELCPIKNNFNNSLWHNIWEVVWDSVAAEIYDHVHAELCFVHHH